ncbi:MAG TPA: hypothetical protein VGK93_04255 [Candidatus Eisenbacteria bacterium]|jgi:hypothetical protein
MSKASIVALAAVLGLLSSGCAVMSVMSDVDQAKAEWKAPANASIQPEGGASILTPCRLDLRTLPDAFRLQITVEGFRASDVYIRRNQDTWSTGSEDLGTVPCLAIDTVNGDIYPTTFDELRRAASIESQLLGEGSRGYLHVVTVIRAEPSWRSILHLLRK